MTHEQFKKLMSDAIKRGEIVSPFEEAWVTWMEKFINGLREVLANITEDEFLKTPRIYLDTFDKYFGDEPAKVEPGPGAND